MLLFQRKIRTISFVEELVYNGNVVLVTGTGKGDYIFSKNKHTSNDICYKTSEDQIVGCVPRDLWTVELNNASLYIWNNNDWKSTELK